MKKYYYALGRRKRSISTIRLFEGNEESMVNDKTAKDVYISVMDQKKLFSPLSITERRKKYYFTAKTKGGGTKGQLGAIVHALSRALIIAEPTLRPILKKQGLLKRDDRKKETKKTGLLKARKAPQFSKR